MNRIFNILTLLILSCLISLGGIARVSAQTGNSLIDGVVNENSSGSVSSEGNNSPGQTLQDLRIKEYNQKLLAQEKLQKEKEEAEKNTPAVNQKTPNFSLEMTDEQRQQNMQAIQEYGQQKWNRQVEAMRGETTEATGNKKGGGQSAEFCSKSCSPRCFYKDLQRCTFCGLFATFFNTASSMAKKAMNVFAGSVVQVVIIAFAIWLAILVLGFISSIETRDIKDLVSSILQQSFLVALVIILLQTGGSSFFNLVLNPIYTTGMNIAQTALSPNVKNIKTDGKTLIVTQGDNSAQIVARLESLSGQKMTDQEKDSYKVVCVPGKPNTPTYIYGYDKGALPKEMGESILCTMTMIQNQASKIKALGSSSICYSWEKRILIFPHLSYLLTGIGLWIGGMILIIAVPFLMIDAVLELAVAAALLPAAIGAYAFKITRRYSKPVWDTFLNSMFVFMFVSLIALMLTTAFEMVLIDETKGNLDTLIFTNDLAFEDIIKELGWFSVAFLKICFALILTWTVMGEAKDFAGQFSGSISSTAIGSQIGTMGGSFTKSAVKKVSSPIAEAAGDHLWRDGGNLLRKPAHLINRARQSISMRRVMKNGTQKGSTITYGNRRIRIDENGNKVLESTKQKTVRNAWGKKLGTVNSTQIQNKHFSVTVQSGTLDDGTAYQRDIIKLNSNAMRNLYNRRGQLNQKLYDDLLDSCGEDKKFKIALMKQIVHHNMPNAPHNTVNHAYTSQEPLIEDGEVIGYVETLPDGSKVEVIIRTNEAGRMMSQITQTDAKGNGVRLGTDGLTNMKSIFKTTDGTADGQIDEDSAKTLRSASAYYQNIRHTGRYKREVLKDGMLGLNEDNWDNFRRSDDSINEFRSTSF